MNNAVRWLFWSLFLGSLLGAQTPAAFVARTRTEVYRIGANGNKTLIGVQVGTYSRSADGTTLQRQHMVKDGKAVNEIGTLTAPDGSVTEIYYDRQEAVLRQEARGAGYVPPLSTVHGDHRTMNGVDCVLVPMAAKVCQGSKCAPEPLGPGNMTCVPTGYGVIVHQDLIETIGGVTRERVRDTYDFEAREPDPAGMQIPAGFARRTALVASSQ